MSTTTTIFKPNTKVIKFIKKEIADKKERHAKMMQTINPSIIETLKSMKKIGG